MPGIAAELAPPAFATSVFTYALARVAPRSAAARVMYDREQYQPLPNFAQPTSAASATNLYFRKRLNAAQAGGPCPPLSAVDLASCEPGLGSSQDQVRL